MRKYVLMILLLAFGVCVSPLLAKKNLSNSELLIKNTLIWRGNQYAAFTSLIMFDKAFYCAFREAGMHVDMSGIDTGHIVVLRSEDGENWQKYLVIDQSEYDLRDPQLFRDSDKNLSLLVERVKYVNNQAIVRESCHMDLMDITEKNDLKPVRYDNNITWNWLWNVNEVRGSFYGFTYVPYFALYKSIDGRQFHHISSPKPGTQPTESAIIDLDKKTLLAVVRLNGFAAIGKSRDDGETWQWKQSAHTLACPKLIHTKGKIILAGRNYDKTSHTSIFVYDKKKNDFDVICDLPDNGDCSYPGIVEKGGYLYISYYQSRGKDHSDIYIAKVKL